MSIPQPEHPDQYGNPAGFHNQPTQPGQPQLPEQLEPEPPADPPRVPSRVAVRAMAYHQEPNAQPVCVELYFSRPLATDGQPCGPRRVRVGEAWQVLDTWDLINVSLIVLENEEGKGLQTIPTDEEAAAVARRVVEIGVAGADGVVVPAFQVRPGEGWPLDPVEVGRVRVRCREGVARVKFTAYPE